MHIQNQIKLVMIHLPSKGGANMERKFSSVCVLYIPETNKKEDYFSSSKFTVAIENSPSGC